ncbi:paxillin-like protein [Leptotrombidium deliense]|uniref:Paxillin-like protein n=1 Tax=Leptotrombidium deliense TaxID=299467 RepID=A0A443SV92_9ACAR|nr:paxillin-like protein [Leptotrombidium deliense]
MRTSWPYGLDDVLRKQKRQEPSADYREPPVNQWSKDNRSGRDLRSTPSVEDLVSYYQRFADRNRSPSPTGSRRARSAGATEVPIRRETAYPTTTQSKSVPSSPIPGWMKQLKHIVVEDMHVPVPPRFGTLAPKPRYPDRAEPPPELGPPCELCHKPITETRCIITENFKYHCWHFVCSFCSKTLQENDFLMAIDNKPYCNNCFKRTYP